MTRVVRNEQKLYKYSIAIPSCISNYNLRSLWFLYTNRYKALLITIDAGDEELFATLENSLLQAIPESTVEWRRSFGRPIKQVKLGASFLSFSRDILPNEKDWHLINQPVLHIYWSECTVSEIELFCACVCIHVCIYVCIIFY